MQFSIENLDEMNDAEERSFWTEFGADMARDDGRAAKEHLAAGFPIYFREGDTPKGLIVKQYPDGRREMVSFHQGVERVVQAAA
ncbi:hypothetical protein [Acidisoma silvae]|uniref:Uncharacterized protein n=1 Tax=Acidisoma silvae TaxID=2802396 RepID=A0A963YUW8_9PROT|nr:hypothetical protein [Acidisoma silvae]MCB8877459.1 hypothetical protein [Acidisoma silvae]